MPFNDQGDAYKLVYPFGWQVRGRAAIEPHIWYAQACALPEWRGHAEAPVRRGCWPGWLMQ